jgi:signal transduction histidine kinase
MTADEKLLRLMPRRAAPALAAGAVLLAAAEIFADWATWVELDVSVLYELPLVVAVAARKRRLLWGLALLLICATFAVYYHQAGAFRLYAPFFINRVLTALSIVVEAALLHVLISALDALEAASERKTRLLASVSHDIRTPLTTISLLADLIRGGSGRPDLAPEQVAGLTQNLQANAASLGELVTDVLDIAYLDSGRVELRESEFAAGDFLGEECRSTAPLVQARRLRLECSAAEPGLRLRADRVKLARVLRNLLSNAIKYTEDGTVTVTAKSGADGSVLIAVSDTGPGIAPEQRERIFGEFTRLDSSRTGEAGGWGLGLAISRRLIHLMGGEITLESEPGRGSTFTIHLPARR